MNSDLQLDVLAFGAHADDVEIGMGGTIAKLTNAGKKVGVCDLTKAELSSNGNVDLRQVEAANAAQALNLTTRIQLDLGDRNLTFSQKKVKEIVTVIRKYKPSVIFSPYVKDRHPDHGACTTLVKEAIFSARISKYETDQALEPHKIEAHYMYMINGVHKPSFIIDISNVITQKKQALLAYTSQFVKTEQAIETPLNNDYIESVIARERLIGKEVGVSYGEGFFSDQPILLHHLLRENI